MGNPDLIVIINENQTYKLNGNDFTRDTAITEAIKRFHDFNAEQSKIVEEAKQDDLIKPKDELLAEMSVEDEVKIIRIYEIF